MPGIETADYEIAEVEHTVDGADRAASRAPRSSATPSARSPSTATRSSRPASPPAATTGHHRRAGLDDRLRREVRRADGRAGPAALARASRRCTRPARSPRTSASRRPGLDTLDILVFWKGVADGRLDADDLRQRRAGEGATTSSRTSTSSGRPTAGSTTSPCRASTRSAWRCRGAARRTRCGSSATRAWPTSRSLGGIFDRALMQGVPQIVGRGAGGDRGPRPTRRSWRSSPSRRRPSSTEMPPRENQRINISVDSVHATGPLGPRPLRAARATATTSRPACSRPTPPTSSCTARRAGSASPRPARRSGTASCSACCRLRADARRRELTGHVSPRRAAAAGRRRSAASTARGVAGRALGGARMELDGKRTLITGAGTRPRPRDRASCSPSAAPAWRWPTSTARPPSRRAASIGGDAIALTCDVTERRATCRRRSRRRSRRSAAST